MKCCHCGVKFTEDTIPFGKIKVEDYGYICEQCFINEYFNCCIECDKVFDTAEMHDTGEGFVCKKCLKEGEFKYAKSC